MQKKFVLVYLLIVLATVNHSNAQEKFQASWESLSKYQCPEWYRDAKFGIFIHWGVYSVPAYGSEWYPREMYQQGSDIFKHHVAAYGPQSKFGYKDFIPMFKAEKFDALQWAELFKKAGAKYVVPVAEHHDGFQMYNSSLSKWNAYNMGPKRDIIGELADAVRKEGLVFGVSSHRIEHWFFMNGGRKFDSDVNDPRYADFYGPAHEEKDSLTAEYMNDWLLRSTELVNKYHPQIFWFDWWIEQRAMEPYRKSFAAFYYNQALAWNKGVVLNYKNKSFPDSAAVLDLERGKLEGIRPLAWQTDDAVGFRSWGYIDGEKYKSPQYVLDELTDIVSKNGNLLMNIGPRADGTIPEEQQQLLLSIGKWLSVNGEAIYGTRPWKIFGEGPTQNVGGSFIDDKVKDFTAKDIRFTAKGDTLYAITLAVPKEDILIQSLSLKTAAANISRVELIGSSERVSWSQKADGLKIKISKNYPSDYAVAYRIFIKK
ncbi:MAG TPA: alpha-L-fucosidase [Puia sp.]|nr:alpha-L-fucosidase [Puia sp.]